MHLKGVLKTIVNYAVACMYNIFHKLHAHTSLEPNRNKHNKWQNLCIYLVTYCITRWPNTSYLMPGNSSDGAKERNQKYARCTTRICVRDINVPDNKVHGANMGPTGPRWPRVGPMNFAICDVTLGKLLAIIFLIKTPWKIKHFWLKDYKSYLVYTTPYFVDYGKDESHK